MTYKIEHGGLTREFDFYAPPGWQYWMGKAWTNQDITGLPLVVALHGGGQDPIAFQDDWFFPRVWDVRSGLDRILRNQMFVLYP